MRPEELGAWQALLQEEFEKPYWRTLAERVDAATPRPRSIRRGRRCLPPSA